MTALEKIAKLNEERYGLTFNKEKAIEKLIEEVEELKDGKDIHDMVDALADIIVIAAGEIRKLGFDPEWALLETIKEITSRKQDPVQRAEWQNGRRQDGEKWLKWKGQPVDTLYSADYNIAKIRQN